ncbi:hypothetical protein AB4084_03045, partial [Lysobacter sp. 2RAB21]
SGRAPDAGGEAAPPWTSWAPEGGWERFAARQAVSDAIWDSVSEEGGQWHYLNPAGGLSIWECSADGSAILIDYRDDRIVALQTNGGAAQRHFLAVAAPFGLLEQAPADAMPGPGLK